MTRHCLDAPDALTDGEWQPRAAVLIWVPDDPASFRRWRTGDGCGTNAGYQQHLKLGKVECVPCRDAHRKDNADYRARQRAAS